MEIGFSLGSNMNDRKRLLIQAKTLLLKAPRTCFVDQSPIYETTPVDVRPEYAHLLYLNSIVIVESEFPLESWLSYITEIVHKLGRMPGSVRNSPRPIDIDIIYAGGQVIDSGGLVVPHPRWTERRFVIEPLCDLRPLLLIPGTKKNVTEILPTLPSDKGMHVIDESW